MTEKKHYTPEEARELILSGNAPDGMVVDGFMLDLSSCENLTKIPNNLEASWMSISGSRNLKNLPDNLQVDVLLMTNCPQIEGLPSGLELEGLYISGSTGLTTLPDDLSTSVLVLDYTNEALIQNTSLEQLERYPIISWHHCYGVPAHVLKHPEKLTPEELLSERHVETRQVMLLRYGERNFIENLGIKPFQDYKYGELYRVEFPTGEPLVMVCIQHRDTQQKYFYRVPPDLKTDLEACAWAFGVTIGEYMIDSETYSLPDDIYLSRLEATELIYSGDVPDTMVVIGSILVRKLIDRLPQKRLYIYGELDVSNNTTLTALPNSLWVQLLNISGCTGLTSLPIGLRTNRLVLWDCINITSLPRNLSLEQIDLNEANEPIIENTPLEQLETYNIHWHYVLVPAHVLKYPERLTPQEILDEPNVEVRRIMLDRYGVHKFIENLGAKPVQQDKYGVLYRVEIPDDEALVMVKVQDASTDRQYFLRVPPDMHTAHQAVAWTFGMTPDEYHPEIET